MRTANEKGIIQVVMIGNVGKIHYFLYYLYSAIAVLMYT